MWATVYDRATNGTRNRYAIHLRGSKRMMSPHAALYGHVVAAIEAHYA